MKKIAIYSIALITTGLVACKNDEVTMPAENNQETVISLSGSILQTRATTEIQSAALSLNNKVGAFGVATEGTLGNHTNNQYTVGQNGTLVAVGSEMSAKKVSTVSIYAYAPYDAAWTLGSNTFTVESDQSTEAGYLASDLLHAKTENVNASNTVSLGFAHKLSQLVVKLNNSDNIDLSGATVSVMNTLPSATLNAQTGELGEAAGNAVEITGAKNVNTNNTYVVIVPQTVAAGTSFIKISGVGEKNLVATLGADQVFEGGKKYTMTVTLGEAGAELTIGSITLSDWTDGGSFEASAKTDEDKDDDNGDDNGDDNSDDNGDDTPGTDNPGDEIATLPIELPGDSANPESFTWTKETSTYEWWSQKGGNLINLYTGSVDPQYQTMWFTISELDLGTPKSSGLRIYDPDPEVAFKCPVYNAANNEEVNNAFITENGTYYVLVKEKWTIDSNTKIQFGGAATSLTDETAASCKLSNVYFSSENPL